MGGFSASTSKSSSSNSTKTESTDKRIGIEGGGLVATEGAQITVDNLSPDLIVSALEQGFDFGKTAIQTVADNKIAELKAFNQASQDAIENISASNTSLTNLLKAGTAIAVVFFVARAWGKK